MMERCPVDSQPIVALDPAWPAMSIAEAEALLTAPGQKFEMETVTIRGVPTRVWKHSPVHLRALIEAARAYGGLPFTIYEDERVSYDANFRAIVRSEEHTSELQSLMRISYAVFCLKKKNMSSVQQNKHTHILYIS